MCVLLVDSPSVFLSRCWVGFQRTGARLAPVWGASSQAVASKPPCPSRPGLCVDVSPWPGTGLLAPGADVLLTW